jgi:HTH-type transcriptional regulator/antitoxin HigA
MAITLNDTHRFEPSYAVPPGETLVDLLEDHEMSQTDLSRRLGISLKHLNQVVNGGASISAELALGLEKVFGVPAAFWLSRESLYRAHLARQEEQTGLSKALGWARRFPIAELKERGFLPPEVRGSELVGALLEFLAVASPEQWRDPTVSYRKSQKAESNRYALAAWLRVGELKAREIECEPFDADRFRDALETVRSLTRLDPQDWQDALTKTCAGAGVAVVIVDAFEGARANGATWWLSPRKALIQLSLRYHWEDIFWFSFFHEAGHVLLHRKKVIFVEPEERSARQSMDRGLLQLEEEADRFAARSLIPRRYERRLPELTLADIPQFAERLNIAPAIVVGRLQHDELIPYSRGNKFRRRLRFVAH